MKHFLALIFLCNIAVSANAASFRVDVNGAFESGELFELSFFDENSSGTETLSLTDPTLPSFWTNRPDNYDLAATQGSVRIEVDDLTSTRGGVSFSNCSGILIGVCLQRGPEWNSFDPFVFFGGRSPNQNIGNFVSYGPVTADSVGSYRYSEIDSIYGAPTWTVDGRTYQFIGGSTLVVRYNLTSTTLTAVPLPASAWALLLSLSLLFGAGKLRKLTSA